jgi:mitochondrial cardiolipin hydrolase
LEKLETALKETFDDYRLSKGEKHAFRELLLPYKNDAEALSFVRNRAFKLINSHMQEAKTFDSIAYKWLEHIVKLLDSVRSDKPHGLSSEVYFSPGSDCKNRIVSLINNAKKSIDACVFTISDDDISHALLSAHKRNIIVRVITDNDKANDLGSDVDRLAQQGLAVIKDISPNHMHHKFALVDDIYLINGSFNWTRSASKYNNENIVILSNDKLLEQFSRKFEEMWQEFGGVTERKL